MTHVLRLTLIVPVLLPALLLGASPASADKEDKDEKKLHKEVEKAKNNWQKKDDSFSATLDSAYAYAIFPEVGKGGFIVGGAHGSGEVYEKQELIGYAKMTQTTIGAQVGGQTFSEVILFENQEALERFKNSRFEGSAAATAVGGKKGAASALKYKDGVAIMVLPLKGAMAEAAAGGQKFKFEPLEK